MTNCAQALMDSHAHLTCDGVYEQIHSLLARAQEAGVERIVNICTDLPTLERGLALHEAYPWVVNVASTTPHDVDREGEAFFPVVEKHALAGDLVAIGETGLDYYYTHSEKETQQEFLRRYLRLALRVNLPVVIHCRDAFEDFFSILDEEYQVEGKHAPGVLHCFTGTLEEAREVVARGWYLSLSGIVTFKRSEELRQVAQELPLEQLLIETDTPYLAPQSRRGKPNEPSYIQEVAAVIAQQKQLPLEQVMAQTFANASALFGLPPS